ncbi:TetR/AcrR family transcriptional regulator [Rhizobium sp. KVB221]|uniref:TetR/AcrR family transcriptional regulator n=1 Tax=Rhizobium setariae TaxID=2801340 RepID=A0A936YV46_9HYPH|nr:TetR/AcrR family transcriptional regulator [Rhizobium setariae]MBL0373350.1 TetR/AcrR family transcriptional regulator [Rhizobium setariae]
MAKQRSVTKTFRSTEDRRTEIVTAAFRCLQEFGYAKLTARKIAEYSNISLGHITYHFKDMNEVLVETYKYASNALLEASHADVASSPSDPMSQLKIFLRTGFTDTFLKSDYIRVRIDLWSAALFHDEIALTEKSLNDRYRENLVEILERIAAERGHDKAKVAFLADNIMATQDGLWLDWKRRHDDSAIRNGLDGCVMLVNAVLREGT